MLSKIVSKVVMDKGVLGGCWEEILLFVFSILRLVGSDMGEDIKTIDWGGGDGGAGNDIGGAIWDVEEGEVFNVIEGGPVDSRR